MNWYYKPACLFYSLWRQLNITQVFIFSDWRMAFLSPSPLSQNVENRENNTLLFLNTILLKRYWLFLFQLFCTILNSICVCTEYICVYNVHYIRLDGLNKEPQASKCNPITMGLAVYLWLFPGPPTSPISLKVRFSRKIHETSSCFIHSLLLGIPRWRSGAVKFLFSPVALIWRAPGNEENEVWKRGVTAMT